MIGPLVGMLLLFECIECHFIWYFKNILCIYYGYCIWWYNCLNMKLEKSREFLPDMHYNKTITDNCHLVFTTIAKTAC